MKKFIILVLAAVLCLAMALPASAEVKVSGMLSFDIYTYYRDEALQAGGVPAGTVNLADDKRSTQMNVQLHTNLIRFTYANKDATIGANAAIKWGMRNDDMLIGDAAAMDFVFSVVDNNFYWKPRPDVKLTFGFQNQLIGGTAPPGILGSVDVIIVGITGGNIAHTSNRMGIVADININDMVTLQLGMYDPDDDGTPALTALPNALGGTSADEQLNIPRFDIAVPIKYGPFSIRPAASWTLREYEQTAPNTDDSFDQWEVALSGKYTFGQLALSGEIATGRNLAGGNYSGPVYSGARTWTDAGGATHIEDGEGTGYWLNVAWTINPKMNLHVFYGSQTEENSNAPGIADDIDVTRSHYGFRFNYYIAPNFMFIPSFIHWDFGDDNQLGTGVATDSGSANVLGAGFLMIF
jgi:hypothetical protein